MNSELRVHWRYWLGALVLIELLGGSAWAQGKGGGGMPVIAATVETRELVDQLKAIGTLEAEAAAEIRPEVVGIVREIDFKEGQRVEQGEVLAIIDDSVYQSELAKAKAEYELARVSSRRNEALRRTGVTSAQQIDEAVIGEQVRTDLLENLEVSLLGVVVIGSDADGLDQPYSEFARDDGSRHEPAARDAHDGAPVAVLAREPPCERARVAMELVPGNGEGLVGKGHCQHSGCRRREPLMECGGN